ncbi:MAG: hypothetical protein PVF58_17115 [Candidatus Methanofastidiosia archaeon]|jgi:hypothetical protein
MSITPKQWSGHQVVLRKTFTSDALAVKDGYTVGKWVYTLNDERIERKKGYFYAYVTARTQSRGWVRARVKIPVVYGDPWKEQLKTEIEKELHCNHDVIGVFLSDVDPSGYRGFQLSWEE